MTKAELEELKPEPEPEKVVDTRTTAELVMSTSSPTAVKKELIVAKTSPNSVAVPKEEVTAAVNLFKA